MLVVGNDLLTEALASALGGCGFATRHVTPSEADVGAATRWRPRLAILDVRSLDEASGVALVTRLRQAGVNVCVMERRGRTRDWLEVGVSAMVDNGSPFDQFFRVINRLAGAALEADPEPRVPEPRDPPSRAQPPGRGRQEDLLSILTERERHVLAELMDGHCAEEIASASCVSISTVRSQIKSILQKLGVNSQLAAVALARRAGWSTDRAAG